MIINVYKTFMGSDGLTALQMQVCLHSLQTVQQKIINFYKTFMGSDGYVSQTLQI